MELDQHIVVIEQFLQANRLWAGPLLALVTLGESVLVIGFVIPATALLLMTGGLLGAGTLPLLPVVLWGIAGAVAGDTLSYWIGRWVGSPLTRRWPLRQQRRAVARTRLFFRKYGFLAILIGRFLGPVRSTVPTIAGVMKMNHARFQLANVLSAVVWVPAMLAPGYLAVRSAGAIGEAQQTGLVMGAVLSVLLAAAVAGVMLRTRRPKVGAAKGR